MQVSDDIRRAVVFLGVEDDTPGANGIRCIGTGFLLGYEECRYLVTAKHVILPLEGAPYRIRVNQIDGGADNIILEEDDNIIWLTHPDRSVDLAIAPFQYDLKKAGKDVLYISGLEKQPKEHGFCCGAFCYTVGLFQLMTGNRRNLPIVHTGNLALLPGDEKIPVRDWENPTRGGVRQVEGFLVEQQSIAGLSGSPVFARAVVELTDLPVDNGKRVPVLLPRRDLALLGVWQGAWDAPPDEIRGVGFARNVRVPVGIGVVIPAMKIVEILNMEEPKKRREALKKQWAEDAAATLDSAALSLSADSSSSDENPAAREDFTNLLNAAARKREPRD